MNITSATTVNYINELRTTNYELIMKNKPNQTQPALSAVEGPVVSLPALPAVSKVEPSFVEVSNLFQIDDFLGIFYLASLVFYLRFLVEANVKGRFGRDGR